MRRRDDDDDETVRDGQTLTVSMMMADAARRSAVTFDARNHRPHHGEMSDEVRALRAKTRSEYLRRLQDAWRLPR